MPLKHALLIVLSSREPDCCSVSSSSSCCTGKLEYGLKGAELDLSPGHSSLLFVNKIHLPVTHDAPLPPTPCLGTTELVLLFVHSFTHLFEHACLLCFSSAGALVTNPRLRCCMGPVLMKATRTAPIRIWEVC